jgi:tetratricopeptide (TPR) repeat protein
MDKKKLASDCYRKGVEAMEKQNWGLAVEMFGVCTKFVPDNVMYRQLLRKSEWKKYDDNKTGAGTFARSKLMGIRSRIKKAKAKPDWEEVDKACEDGLALNPWDVQLNVELAEAARAREYMEVARFAMLEARNADPNNKELNYQLAELLEQRGEYDEASKIWQHICKLDPLDGNARSRLSGAHMKKTIDRGGYENAESTRNVMAKGPKSGEAAAPGESQESDLKHAIRKEPQKVENYLKLGDWYKREGRLDEAHQTFETALQVSGDNANVREQLEDIELLRMGRNVELAKEKATATGDEETRKVAAALATEFAKRKLEILSRRVERYPQDLILKYDLAELLMTPFGKYTQAIPLLQQASQNKRLKARALIKLGRCFIQDKKISLARGQIERGVAEVNAPDDPKLFVEAHYMLGRVCEELKDFPAAEKHYGEVLVVDYEYKDALARLEKLQGGGGDTEG